MKKIFIYYSLSGNGDLISEYLASKKVDILKVETVAAMPKKYFLQILVGGFKASINSCAKLKKINVDITSYDEIIIGSPIWNDRLTPAINTVLKKLDLSTKKLTFILYSASGKAKKATEKIQTLYPDAQIIILREPKKNGEYKKLLDNI